MSTFVLLALVIGLAAGAAAGAAVGYLLCKSRFEAQQAEARNDARSIIDDANRTAETSRREAELTAKETALGLKDEAEAEIRARRAEVSRIEERLDNRDTAPRPTRITARRTATKPRTARRASAQQGSQSSG